MAFVISDGCVLLVVPAQALAPVGAISEGDGRCVIDENALCELRHLCWRLPHGRNRGRLISVFTENTDVVATSVLPSPPVFSPRKHRLHSAYFSLLCSHIRMLYIVFI